MWSQNPSFRIEIEEFWKKKKADHISSNVFVAGGCEWFLYVYPKGCHRADNNLSVYLRVANPKSLRVGWKRNVSFYFTVLNHLNIERCRSNVAHSLVYDAKAQSWGFRNVFPLSQFKEEWFMGKESLTIEVYVNVIEAVDGESEDVSEKETVDINGFQVSASQVALVKKIFAEHPDITLGFKPKNQVVKAAYMNVLLGVINTLDKPSESHSEAELIIIINGSSPTSTKPISQIRYEMKPNAHTQRSSSCTRQNKTEKEVKAECYGKGKQKQEDHPAGNAQVVMTQNRYSALEDEIA